MQLRGRMGAAEMSRLCQPLHHSSAAGSARDVVVLSGWQMPRRQMHRCMCDRVRRERQWALHMQRRWVLDRRSVDVHAEVLPSRAHPRSCACHELSSG